LYVPHLAVICIGAFGLLAFVLVAVGLHGAVFYSVSERTRKAGIRVALGASPPDLWIPALSDTAHVFGALATHSKRKLLLPPDSSWPCGFTRKFGVDQHNWFGWQYSSQTFP